MRGLAGTLLLLAGCAWGQSQPPRRLVIVKLDGVPADILERTMRERSPRTGKSKLPWMEEIFARHGTTLAHFYVRGISLSAPSWAMLDTGYPQRIHGNVEYDRLTLGVYDYLNFFPFYLNNAMARRADMPGVEVLDASGVPLLIDQFPWEQRYQSFQLFQRWVRWKTLQKSLQNRFTSRSPKELFDEWQLGFGMGNGVYEQTEREVLQHLQDPNCLYLDYYSGEFDHTAHLTNDHDAQVAELERNDALVGRIWSAIRSGPLAERTLLVLVSDHGMNTEQGIYSQGYSLVEWLRSAAGGGHHTATDRYPLTEFKVKGLDPFVSEVISASHDSAYLKGEQQQYPTAYLDVDGNERAALQLRNSDLNALHILLKQIARKETPGHLRQAATETFFDILDAKRERWERTLRELREELAALRQAIAAESAATRGQKLDKEDQAGRRRAARLLTWQQGEQAYSEYARVMANLLGMKRGPIDTQRLHIEELIPKRSLGEPNTIYDLQHYVVGPSREGLTLSKDGTRLDQAESFRTVNYFEALRAIAVRNNVQEGVGSEPVDFIAAQTGQGIWLYGDAQRQVLIQSRRDEHGELQLRYLPVAGLRGDPDGSVSWSDAPWRPDLPLMLARDEGWHTDREWLKATHLGRYSDGIVAIHEQFESPLPRSGYSAMLLRYEARRRRLVLPDLVLLANNYWNFNVRGFNPGGNHGSFFGISTHSVFMLAGGAELQVPQGLTIDEPYDSLSFAPTVLKLVGRDCSGMPGPLVQELFPAQAR